MFCISCVTTYVANDVAENLICSWNHHRTPGPQECVPVENMQLPAAELILTVSEAVKMCEERGGSLACDATFGTDPLATTADLIDSHEKIFFFAVFRTKHINLLMLYNWSKSQLKKIEYFVDVTIYLTGYPN